MNNSEERLFESFRNNLQGYGESSVFNNLKNAMFSQDFNIELNESFLLQEIDARWVEEIEKVIIPIDNIIRTPNKFIKNDEEVVPISLAKGITVDSIKHLAQHTDYIESIDKKQITPSKILSVNKEENYETYENRFIYTLLYKIQYFLDKKMNVINEKATFNNSYEMKLNGSFKYGHDQIKYDVNLSFVTPNKSTNEEINALVYQNIENLSLIQRIERLRKIFYNFQSSRFCKLMANATFIKPPLTMTNLLTKNPDYRACVDLYAYIESGSSSELKFNVVNRKEKPNIEVATDIITNSIFQYLALKSHTSGLSKAEAKQNNVETIMIDEKVEQIIESYDYNIDVVKRIFVEKIKVKEKKIHALERRMLAVIEEGIQDENNYKLLRQQEEKKAKLNKFLKTRTKK